MKTFIAPEIIDMNDIVLEPVFAASGWVPEDPKDDPKPAGDWTCTAEWRNHNSGSHSELAIKGIHRGTTSGNTLTMTFKCVGFKLAGVKDNGGWPVSNVTPDGFTITRNNFFNPTDNFEFNIQLTSSDSVYHGSVGKTGEIVRDKYCECVFYVSA